MVRFSRVRLAAVLMCPPSVIRCCTLMRHNGGNTLKSQDRHEGLRALPLKAMECGQFHYTACQGYFPEHHGTILHGKQMAMELIVRVLACLALGLGIRATARVFEVDPNTVLQWLGEALDQLQAFAHYFLCELHVRQLQVDELYAVLKAMKAGDLSEGEAIRHLSPSPHWVWTAMDPETKFLLGIDVGTR